MSFDPRDPAGYLKDILEWLEARIDLDHLAGVEERFRAAYHWEPVDRPPLIISCEVPAPFVVYPYRDAFYDMIKMMVNELVGPGLMFGFGSVSVVNSVVIKDDFPLQIRPNYGIGLLPSMLGGTCEVPENAMPWVKPIGIERLRPIIAAGVPQLAGGLFAQAMETMDFFREKLAPYPKCRQAIRITQPDLQGPFENLAQLWGGDIMFAYYEDPAFLIEGMEFMCEAYLQVCRKLTEYATQDGPADLIYLHYSMQRGKCLLKDDSSVMISPKAFVEFIRPMNGRILTEMGGGSVHYCGQAEQWRNEFPDTPGLLGMDLGQPYMVDMPAWKPLLQAKGISFTNAPYPLEEWEAREPLDLLPTGASFRVDTGTLDAARRLLDGLNGRRAEPQDGAAPHHTLRA